MKIIAPIIQFYEDLFFSEESIVTIGQFNDKEKLLFDKIREGKIENDKQAASLLYDGNPSSQAYSKMKQKLLDKLFKIVMNSEYQGNNKGTQKLKSLSRSMYIFDTLVKGTTYKAAIQLAKKIVIQAERVQRYHEAQGIAAFLSNHYYTFEMNESQGSKYWEKYVKFNKLYSDSRTIIYEYGKLFAKTKKSSYSQELANEAQEVFENVKHLTDPLNYVSMKFYYQIGYLRYAVISDNYGVIENNLTALRYFDESKDIYETTRNLFKLQLVMAYLGNGDYKNAANYLNSLETHTTDSRYLTLLSLHVKIALHVQEYQKAIDLVETTVTSKQLKQAPPTDQQRFWLYKYYADIMQSIIHSKTIKTRQVRNNLTRLAIDKKGLNITYLIAETIVDIIKDGITSIYSKVDSLKSYSKKHLKKGENDRSAMFINFLISLPDSEYNKSKFYSNLEQTVRFFEENPAFITTKPDNEIIPYENLLHELLKYLKISSTQEKNQELPQNSTGSAASDF